MDAETSGKQPIEDDQETLLAEPILRQKLETFGPTYEEPIARPRAEAPRETEKPDWAKDLAKTMAQIQLQIKEKGIDAPLDYTDLDLYKGVDPLPRKFKFPDMKKYSGVEDPHLHLK